MQIIRKEYVFFLYQFSPMWKKKMLENKRKQ